MESSEYADAAREAWGQFKATDELEFVELAAMIVRTGLKDDEKVANNSETLQSVFAGCINDIVELCQQTDPDLQRLRALCLLSRLAFRTSRLQRKFSALRTNAIKPVLTFLFAQEAPDRVLGNDVWREKRCDAGNLQRLALSSVVDLAGLLTFKPVSILYKSPQLNDEALVFESLIPQAYNWALRWLHRGNNVPEWTFKVLSSFFYDVAARDTDADLQDCRDELVNRLLDVLGHGHACANDSTACAAADTPCIKATADCIASWCYKNPSLQPCQLDPLKSALLDLGQLASDPDTYLSVVKAIVSCTFDRLDSLGHGQFVRLLEGRPEMGYQENAKLLKFASLLLRGCVFDEDPFDKRWLKTFRDVANTTIVDAYDAAEGAMWPLLHCEEAKDGAEAMLMSSVAEIAFSSLSWCEAAFDQFATQFWLGDVRLDDVPDGSDLNRICFSGLHPAFVETTWMAEGENDLSHLANPPFVVEVLYSLVKRCLTDDGTINADKAQKQLSKAFVDKLKQTLQELSRDGIDDHDMDASLRSFLVGYVLDAFVLTTEANDKSKDVFNASVGRPLLWKPPGDLFEQLVLIDLSGSSEAHTMDACKALQAVPSFQPAQEDMIRLFHGSICSCVTKVLDRGVWLEDALSVSPSDFRPHPHLAFDLSEAFSHALKHAENRVAHMKLDSALPTVMVFDVPIKSFQRLKYLVASSDDEWRRTVFSCRTMANRRNDVTGLYQKSLAVGDRGRVMQELSDTFSALGANVGPGQLSALVEQHPAQRAESAARDIEQAARQVIRSLQQQEVIVGEYWRKGKTITQLEKQPSTKPCFRTDPDCTSLDILPEFRFSTSLELHPEDFPVQYAFLSPPNPDFRDDCPSGMKLLAKSLKYVIRFPAP